MELVDDPLGNVRMNNTKLSQCTWQANNFINKVKSHNLMHIIVLNFIS